MPSRNFAPLEKVSIKITKWIGTPFSIIIHTVIFMLFTYLIISGFDFNKVILIWNTSVSLEAIYLALFIQMTVNRNTESLEEVEEDIEDIQEEASEEEEAHKVLIHIVAQMKTIQHELDILKKSGALKNLSSHRIRA